MKLSIVIPASGSQAEIDDTLISVLENRPADCEILLSHPEGYRDPYELEDEVRLIAGPHPDSVSLLNAGISMAQGHIVHTLCPGTRVQSGWCDHAVHAFEEDASVGSVAVSVFMGDAKHPLRGVAYHVGAGRRLVRRKNQTVLAPLLTSGFYLRRAMQFMHSFDTRFQAWADIELGLRMFSAKYRCVSEGNVQIHMPVAKQSRQLTGFRAGQIRGSLFARARAFGFAQTQGLALLSEPFRHAWGFGMVTGLVGRLACRHLQLTDCQVSDVSTETASSQRAA